MKTGTELSFKEKKKIILEIQNEAYADADLELLRRLTPGYAFMHKIEKNPVKHHKEILTELVEKTDRDTIRQNRREYDKNNNPEANTGEEENNTGGNSETTGENTDDGDDGTGNVVTLEGNESTRNSADGGNTSLENKQDEESKKKILTKEEEYPAIQWDNLTDPNIQLATLVYNDRIYTHRKMKALDEELEQKPTPKKVKDLAELRIRNLQSFSELQSFNDTKKWKYEHPLLIGHSERSQLEELRRKDPTEFLKQYANCSKNIQRYQSYLKNPDRKDKKESDKKNLEKHRQRELLFKSILEAEQS